MEMTTILGIFFIAAIALLLGSVLIGSVSTSVSKSITDNETKESFNRVDTMGAQSFSLLGSIGLPLIIIGGFIIIVMALRR
jgi:hypothetical protein